MTILRQSLALCLGAFALLPALPAYEDPPKPVDGGGDLSGLHAFDLRAGEWRVRNRLLKERLANCHEWIEFGGTQSFRLLMGGRANMDENQVDKPGGPYQGVTLRAYDPRSGQWSIWWLDGRNPMADLDPPLVGRFKDGVGTFYSDDTYRGKPIRVRYLWSRITAASAHWEQAFSPDGGKTWETNWIIDFEPMPPGSAGAAAKKGAGPMPLAFAQ